MAGMLVAPLLLACLLRARTRRGWILSHAAVAVVFSVINLSPVAATLFSDAFALVRIPFRVWSDPSDLVVLPLIALSWIVFANPARTNPRPSASPWLQRLAIVVGATACLASSPWPVARPTTVDDRVLVEHPRGVMFVIDAQSGSMIRSLRATGTNEAPPAIFDRILYQVQSDGRVTGIHIDNPQTPFHVWNHPDPETWIRILRVDAHRLYIASGDHQLSAVDRVFGTTRWTLPVDTEFLEELTIAGDTMLLSDADRARAVNVRTGQILWTFRAAGTTGAPYVDGDTAYVASFDGVVHGLDLSTGQPLWRYESGEKPCYRLGPRVFVQSGHVFACFDGETRGISVASRRVSWSQAGQPMALAQGVLILGRGSDTLTGVATNTGKVVWSRELSKDLGTRPVVDGDTAFVRGDDGTLYAIDLRTGVVRWTFDWPQSGGGREVAVGGSALVLSGG
jgi:outer membrane protein assembly factor BamB